MITPSVITSSSNWRLGDLIREVREANPNCKFDLFLLREVDIEQCERPSSKGQSAVRLDFDPVGGALTDNDDQRSLAGILGAAGDGNLKTLLERLDRRLRPIGASFENGIAAIATYLPWISSLDEERRTLAVRAVVQSLRFAFGVVELGWMERPIVEIVCGSLIESCQCKSCRAEKRVFLARHNEKRTRLAKSLREIVADVKNRFPNSPFALALELEPGPSYVLNSRDAVKSVLDDIRGDELLKNHVGLNLDIAHARLANVRPKWLRENNLVPQIVHAHICDHPRMHTRDQPLGTWTSTYSGRQFNDYVDLLFERNELSGDSSDSDDESQLPFSRSVAIELEGSNQISWIHRSVNRLNRVIQQTEYLRDRNVTSGA